MRVFCRYPGRDSEKRNLAFDPKDGIGNHSKIGNRSKNDMGIYVLTSDKNSETNPSKIYIATNAQINTEYAVRELIKNAKEHLPRQARIAVIYCPKGGFIVFGLNEDGTEASSGNTHHGIVSNTHRDIENHVLSIMAYENFINTGEKSLKLKSISDTMPPNIQSLDLLTTKNGELYINITKKSLPTKIVEMLEYLGIKTIDNMSGPEEDFVEMLNPVLEESAITSTSYKDLKSSVSKKDGGLERVLTLGLLEIIDHTYTKQPQTPDGIKAQQISEPIFDTGEYCYCRLLPSTISGIGSFSDIDDTLLYTTRQCMKYQENFLGMVKDQMRTYDPSCGLLRSAIMFKSTKSPSLYMIFGSNHAEILQVITMRKKKPSIEPIFQYDFSIQFDIPLITNDIEYEMWDMDKYRLPLILHMTSCSGYSLGSKQYHPGSASYREVRQGLKMYEKFITLQNQSNRNPRSDNRLLFI